MQYNFFVYILVKKDIPCFKVGSSRTISTRLRNLSNYGAFDINKSIFLPSNTITKMKDLEKNIKNKFKKYNFQIEKLKKSNGETEWYHIECLDNLIKYLQEELKHSISANIKIIDKDIWGDKITNLLLKTRTKQNLYNQKIELALNQYITKQNNYKEFTKLINSMIPLEIVYIDFIKTIRGFYYKVLCKKNGKETQLLNNPKINLVREKEFSISSICTLSKENSNYICYQIDLSNNDINKSWLSKDFCKELNDYLYNRGYKKDLLDEFTSLLNLDMDYSKPFSVNYTGNKIIDDYIFNPFGEFDRFLPHKMSEDFLRIIYNDLSKNLESNYVYIIFLTLLAKKEFLKGKDILNSTKFYFSPIELNNFFNNFYFSLFCEIARRMKYIIKYELFTLENMLESKEDTIIEFNKDLILNKILERENLK